MSIMNSAFPKPFGLFALPLNFIQFGTGMFGAVSRIPFTEMNEHVAEAHVKLAVAKQAPATGTEIFNTARDLSADARWDDLSEMLNDAVYSLTTTTPMKRDYELIVDGARAQLNKILDEFAPEKCEDALRSCLKQQTCRSLAATLGLASCPRINRNT